MFDLPVVNVAIGIILVYALTSIICSHVAEYIAKLMKQRAKMLEASLRAMLTSPAGTQDFVNKVLGHPLIKNLCDPKKGKFPSYIPSRTFALALLDTVAPADPATPPQTFDTVRTAVALLPADSVRTGLLALVDAAQKDLPTARANVERWFDDAMDRAAGWYKKKIKLVLLFVGLGVTVAMNLDSVAIVKALWNSPALQQRAVTSAVQIVREVRDSSAAHGTSIARDTTIDFPNAATQLKAVGFPIGWSAPGSSPADIVGWLVKILGFIITAAFVSLGAPFWFDLLNNIINIRMSGAKPEKSGA